MTMYFLTRIHLTRRLKYLANDMVPTVFPAISPPIACLIPSSSQMATPISLSSPKYWPNVASPGSCARAFSLRTPRSSLRSAALTRSDFLYRHYFPVTHDAT